MFVVALGCIDYCDTALRVMMNLHIVIFPHMHHFLIDTFDYCVERALFFEAVF